MDRLSSSSKMGGGGGGKVETTSYSRSVESGLEIAWTTGSNRIGVCVCVCVCVCVSPSEDEGKSILQNVIFKVLRFLRLL
jgi:hypothetical protein